MRKTAFLMKFNSKINIKMKVARTIQFTELGVLANRVKNSRLLIIKVLHRRSSLAQNKRKKRKKLH